MPSHTHTHTNTRLTSQGGCVCVCACVCVCDCVSVCACLCVRIAHSSGFSLSCWPVSLSFVSRIRCRQHTRTHATSPTKRATLRYESKRNANATQTNSRVSSFRPHLVIIVSRLLALQSQREYHFCRFFCASF